MKSKILILFTMMILSGCQTTQNHQELSKAVLQANQNLLIEHERTRQARAQSGADKIKIDCPSGCSGLKIEIPTDNFGGNRNDQPTLIAMPKAPKNIHDTFETALGVVERVVPVIAATKTASDGFKMAAKGFKALEGTGNTTYTGNGIVGDKNAYSDNGGVLVKGDQHIGDTVTQTDVNNDKSQNDYSQHDFNNDKSQNDVNNDKSQNDYSQHDFNNDKSQSDISNDKSQDSKTLQNGQPGATN